jgi:EmrB/QacA subfamily drug resistance transporter
MKPPCEELAIASKPPGIPCAVEEGPWILAVTILGSSMAFIDSTVVNVALPALQTSFGGTVVDIQWVIESYALFLGSLILAGGSMGDLFGRRRVFLVGVTIFAIASAGCGLAVSIRALVVARGIQGIGAALFVPASLSIISASFSAKERGRAIGTWSGFTAITTALGPILGGWLIEHASWRWVFFINVPIAAVVIALSLRHLTESKGELQESVDWIGALMVTVGLAGVTYGFTESAKMRWSNAWVWGALIVGGACLVAFCYVEGHSRAPMVPPALFRSRDFTGANLLTLFLYAALGIFFFLFPLNLIQVQHYSATATGAAALPLILFMFSLSRWSGGLTARYGAKPPLIIGPMIAAAGFLIFALPSVGGNYWMTFFPGFVVLGLGMAVSVAPLTTVVMAAAGQNHAGTASGVNNAAARVAGLLAIAILGTVMVGAFSHRTNQNLMKLHLPPEVKRTLQSNEIRLAALPVPPDLDPRTTAALRASTDGGFVFGFRIIMLICAALAITSAAVAWRTIGEQLQPTQNDVFPRKRHRMQHSF